MSRLWIKLPETSSTDNKQIKKSKQAKNNQKQTNKQKQNKKGKSFYCSWTKQRATSVFSRTFTIVKNPSSKPHLFYVHGRSLPLQHLEIRRVGGHRRRRPPSHVGGSPSFLRPHGKCQRAVGTSGGESICQVSSGFPGEDVQVFLIFLFFYFYVFVLRFL